MPTQYFTKLKGSVAEINVALYVKFFSTVTELKILKIVSFSKNN